MCRREKKITIVTQIIKKIQCESVNRNYLWSEMHLPKLGQIKTCVVFVWEI